MFLNSLLLHWNSLKGDLNFILSISDLLFLKAVNWGIIVHMRKRFYLLLLAIPVICLTNCGKDDDPPPDSPSVININTPTPGTVLLNGTQMQITGDVADNNALETVRVEVRNTATNTVLFQQNNTTGNVLFHIFQWNWNITGINTTTNATVKVTSTDRYGYQVSEEVAVVLVD